MVKDKPIGKITHYFEKIGVAVIEITSKMNVGDSIKIKGATTDFEQEVESMQVEHEQIKQAKKGQAIGIKVKDKVRPGDLVYLA